MLRKKHLASFPALIAALLLVLVPAGSATAQVPPVALAANVPPSINGGLPAGRTAANQPVTLVIGLKLPDPGALNSAALAIRSGQARPLTVQQFTDRYAPASSDYASVVSFLKEHGFAVRSSSDRLTVTATGTVAQAEQTFGVRIDNYVKNGRTYYANAAAPLIPAGLAGTIQSVAGLDDVPVFHTMSRLLPASGQSSGSYYGACGFTPLGIQKAYDVTPVYKTVNGSGQGIDIIIWDSLQMSDIDTFDQSYGLPPASVNQIPVGGASAPLDYNDGSGEATIDAEWSHALAPAATINVFEATSNSVALLEMAIHRAIRRHDADVLSMSWTAPEDGLSRAQICTMHALFAEGAVEGMTMLAASGDSGAFGDDGSYNSQGTPLMIPDYPASDPFVTGVGGTVLSVRADGAYAGETAWNAMEGLGFGAPPSYAPDYQGGGGGFSQLFPAPEWQEPTVDDYTYDGRDYNPGGMRGVPDVALNAGAGTAAYVDGMWGAGIGTSFGAPSWAALVALADEGLARSGRPVSLNPTLAGIGTGPYYTSVFHEVYVGDNYTLGSGVGPYYAANGWNPVTGWGTPDFARLFAYLVNGTRAGSVSPGPPGRR